MLRSSLVAAGAAVLCAVASAQNVDLSRIYPITTKIKDAGVYDMKTGRFYPRTQASAQGAVGVQCVYDNRCSTPLGSYYVGSEFCDDNYDEGRVPVVVAGGGASADNNLTTWQIGYCTFTVTGIMDLDWDVRDTVNGGSSACSQLSSATPQTVLAYFDSSAAGFPLPGSTTCGTQACWLVTFTTASPVCMQSGATSLDLFNWRFRQNNTPAQNCNGVQGPILAGWPGAGVSSCTYTVACGTDPIGGNTCGHGLDQDDSWWINVDNTIQGGTPPVACVGSPPVGTNCYWFGGYPTNIWAGLWFRMEADGGCSCTGNIITYCTSKTNTEGCAPQITMTGAPDINAGTGCIVATTQERAGKSGLFFHGTGVQAALTFHGGYLCMKGTTKRHAPKAAAGTGTACNGSYSEDFNVYFAAGSDPALAAGTSINVQKWSRDPQDAFGDNLSNAVRATICP